MSEPDRDRARCSACVYWHSWPGQPMAGTCKRYPKAEHKMADDWCGEWLEREPRPWEREP